MWWAIVQIFNLVVYLLSNIWDVIVAGLPIMWLSLELVTAAAVISTIMYIATIVYHFYNRRFQQGNFYFGPTLVQNSPGQAGGSVLTIAPVVLYAEGQGRVRACPLLLTNHKLTNVTVFAARCLNLESNLL